MKSFRGYTLPDNAKLAGVLKYGCYYCNSIGDIYQVTLVGGVQHFRLMHFGLNALKYSVDLYEI